MFLISRISPVFLLVALAALPAPVALRAQTPIQMEIRSLDASGFPIIRMKVNFTQERQTFRRITADDITLRENQNFESITLDCPNNPVAVALVLDRSLSMAFKPNTQIPDIPDSVRWKSCKTALNIFIDQLNAIDVCTFITFNQSVRVDVPFTNNRKNLHDAVAGVKLGSGTAAWAAGLRAVNLLSARAEQRAVVFLTDGEDNWSWPTELVDVINAARTANVRFYTIGLGEEAGRTALDSLATLTGGRFYFSATGSDLTDIYFEIAQKLAADCDLSYTSTAFCADSTRRDIHIMVTNGAFTAACDTFYTAPYRPERAFVSMQTDIIIRKDLFIRVPVTVDLSSGMSPFSFQGSFTYPTNLMSFVGIGTTKTVLDGVPVDVNDADGLVSVRFTMDTLSAEPTLLFDMIFEPVATPVADIKAITWTTSSAAGQCPLLLTVGGAQVYADAICDRILVRRPATLLRANWPNPFNESTTLAFTVPSDNPVTHVEIRIEDGYGRSVATPVAGTYMQGDHSVTWNTGSLPTGTYRAILTMNGCMETMPLVKVK